MKHLFSRSCYFTVSALVIANATHAADLTGTGYVDLVGNTSVPVPSTASGKRFVWTPLYNRLFIGYVGSGQSFSSDSVSLLGNAFGGGVSIGHNSSSGPYGTALGFASSAVANSISIGNNSVALSGHAIAIGSELEDYDGEEHTYYYPAEAIGSRSVAIGMGASSNGIQSLALGPFAQSSGDGAVGINGNAVGNDSVAIRGGAVGVYSATIGGNAVGDWSFAGPGAVAYSKFGTVFGIGADTNHRKDNSVVDPVSVSVGDPVFIVGNGTHTSYYAPGTKTNAFTLYRDGSARFGGEIQIKAGSGYLTLQPSGTTNRTLTLPDSDGALLANTSVLDATKLINAVPVASLPTEVSQLGATVNLDSAEVEGNLPWSRVSSPPATLAGYGITDGLAVARNGDGRITTPIRIEPQGDIPMFAASP